MLSIQHARFWEQCHPPRVPEWVEKLKTKHGIFRTPARISIDEIVNLNDPDKPHSRDARVTATILCTLVERASKRQGSALPFLDRIAIEPGTLIRGERRSAFAKKWAKMIRKRA